MTDWKREIAIAYLVQTKLAGVDSEQLWDYRLPELAAPAESIREVERKLGHRLNDEHKQFLLHANGWNSFYQSVDILGTSDICEGPKHLRGQALMASLDGLQQACGLKQEDLLPIAVASTDIDIFLIAGPRASEPGAVFWFAGQLIDKFPTFSEWFLSMIDYNRMAYQKMTGGQ